MLLRRQFFVEKTNKSNNAIEIMLNEFYPLKTQI